MRVDNKRIFISDLPETATKEELETIFNEYGKVTSVDIKERKELGPKNTSLFFAYVNADIDDRQLQQCFQDFSSEKWHGQYVNLQIARESFLDRLKREREENDSEKKTETASEPPPKKIKPLTNGINNKIVQKPIAKQSDSSSSSSEDSSSDSEKDTVKKPVSKTTIKESKKQTSSPTPQIEKEESIEGFVIKSNKNKSLSTNGLQIPSVGKSPIITIDKSKNKPQKNTSESNVKRLQSLSNLKKGYQTQKSLIQAALSNVDNKPRNKIVFDEKTEVNSKRKSQNAGKVYENSNREKQSLFNDEDSEKEGEELNFEVREQFQGKKGQKLLELQSKFKNDKRFALDSRFLDESEDYQINQTENLPNENEEMSLEEEKKKEYEILEKVLGKKIVSKSTFEKETESRRKSMLRFDPSQPEHTKYELKMEEKEKKKRKKGLEIDNLHNEKRQQEKKIPEVSKEIFYKITDDLKQSLHKDQEFSLLSMFGKSNDDDKGNDEQKAEDLPESSGKVAMGERNPFRYDSSDDEDETEDIPEKDVQKATDSAAAEAVRKTADKSFWSDPFFFKQDDYRLQEGFDFVEKMKLDENTEFNKLRRNLKEIVKAKVRNNQRKNKPFKKKLGGNKRKRMIRIKKALKR